MSATMKNRMGRNPFGSAIKELREEIRKEAFDPSTTEGGAKGAVEWAAVELPAHIYLTVLKAWLSWT